MAKSAKPKKKYSPKLVRTPSLVTRLNSFLPFEKALQEIINTRECEVDSVGNLIYRDGLNNKQSFTATLKVYMEIIDIYAKRNNIDYDSKKINKLYNALFEGIKFEEEEIINAEDSLIICKNIIGKIKPTELFSILDSIRISSAMEQNMEESLKKPENLLAKLKYRVGDLTQEEVTEKNNKFQQLVKNSPENDRYVKLRDVYVEYAAAYQFYNIQKRQTDATIT